MFPVIVGIAAAALLLGGCSRREENTPAPSAPPPLPPEPSVSPSQPRLRSLGSARGTRRWEVPSLLPNHVSSAQSFGSPTCNVAAPRPERFVIQDARQEYCRLHELLRGSACRIEDGRMVASEESRLTSIFSLIPQLREDSNFSAVSQNMELRGKLGQLEGLQMYLYSGRPCEFDGLQDLMDLMEAYTLYRAVARSADGSLRRGFEEGRVGCVLRRGILQSEGEHDHVVNGVNVHHSVERIHDALLTPARVSLDHLPEGTPVSDCLVVR